MNQRFSKFIFPLIKHLPQCLQYCLLDHSVLEKTDGRIVASGPTWIKLFASRTREAKTPLDLPQVDEKGRTLIKSKTSHASSKGLFACRSRVTPTLASRALESKSPCRKIHSPLDRLAGPEYFCTKNHNCHTIKTRKWLCLLNGLLGRSNFLLSRQFFFFHKSLTQFVWPQLNQVPSLVAIFWFLVASSSFRRIHLNMQISPCLRFLIHEVISFFALTRLCFAWIYISYFSL